MIGWPIIRHSIWRLNGTDRQFSILKAVPSEAAEWVKLKERTDRKLLTLELPQENLGQPAYIGIDSGSDDGITLFPEQWTRWRSAHPWQPVTLVAYFNPAAGIVVSEVSWAEDVDLFGLTLRGVAISRANPVQIQLMPTGTVAILGLAALLRLDVIFDGKSGVTYAHPLITQPKRYKHNRLGAVFVPAGLEGNDLVAHVVEGSPAAMAGLKDGDILLKIDQLDVTSWQTTPGILPLSRFWEQAPGTRLRLKLKRAGKVVVCNVELRTILGP